MIVSTRLLKQLVTGAALSAASSALGACPDLNEDPITPDIVAEFASEATFDQETIQFKLKLTNCGADMDETQTMHSKALLIPKQDYAKQLVGQGIVLESFATALQLQQNQSTIVEVSQKLPALAANEYFLAVTINTKAAPIPEWNESAASRSLTMLHRGFFPTRPQIAPDFNRRPLPPRYLSRHGEQEFIPETIVAQHNNITHQMLDLGHLPALIREPKTGRYDLYHEVANASFNLGANTAMHRSRNILRIMEGEDEIPSSELWANTISARFVFLDLKQGTAYIGAYTSQAIDKVWTAIAWNAEQDAKGRNIYVDYYSNAPIISNLEPGQYVLGVLMNVTDRFTLDSYPENNLDLTHVEVPKTGSLSMPAETWINLSQNDQGYIFANVLTPVDPNSWSYHVVDQPSWLKINEYRSDYSLDLGIEVDNDAPIGIHRFKLNVNVMVQGVMQSKSTELVIIKPEGPIVRWIGIEDGVVLKPESPNVRLEDRHGVRYLTINFGLQNAGVKPLIYQFSSYYGQTYVTPADRLVPPGGEHEIQVTLPLVGIALSRGESSISNVYVEIQTNTGNRYLNINYDVKAMLEH